jgi:hypothetical protein
MKVPTVSVRVLSVLVLFMLAGFPVSASAQEAVDFGKAPAAGLEYKVVSRSHGEGSMSGTMGEQSFQRKQTSDRESTYIDSILAVKNGKIVKMEREYEDVSGKVVTESDRLPEPRKREQDSPLAWKRFRVEWNEDGEATARVKEDDAWGEVGEQLKRQLRPKQVRRPFFPLPQESKTVGESWELSDEQAKAYFPPRRRRRRGGGESPPIPQRVSGKLTLEKITDFQDLRCAVIKASFVVEIGESGDNKTKLTQTCYYSLKHRIVVGIRGSSSGSMSRSGERQGRSFEVSSSSTGTLEVKVTIVNAGKAEGGDE